jgi:hypothetical protein
LLAVRGSDRRRAEPAVPTVSALACAVFVRGVVSALAAVVARGAVSALGAVVVALDAVVVLGFGSSVARLPLSSTRSTEALFIAAIRLSSLSVVLPAVLVESTDFLLALAIAIAWLRG